ncbi:unnamed protein product, partial [Polarella glacialis]
MMAGMPYAGASTYSTPVYSGQQAPVYSGQQASYGSHYPTQTMPVQYSATMMPGGHQAMDGPFKFFTQTPSSFLPDGSPVHAGSSGIYSSFGMQSMGVQTSLSPAHFASM